MKELYDILDNIDWSSDDFSDDTFRNKIQEYMGSDYEIQTWDINDEWQGDMVDAANAIVNFVENETKNKKLIDIQKALFQTNDLGMAVYVVVIKAE